MKERKETQSQNDITLNTLNLFQFRFDFLNKMHIIAVILFRVTVKEEMNQIIHFFKKKIICLASLETFKASVLT